MELTKTSFYHSEVLPPYQWGLEYSDCVPCISIRPHQKRKKGYLEYDTKLYLVARV